MTELVLIIFAVSVVLYLGYAALVLLLYWTFVKLFERFFQ